MPIRKAKPETPTNPADILKLMDPKIARRLIEPQTRLVLHDNGHHRIDGKGWQDEGATLFINGVPTAEIDIDGQIFRT